MENAGEFWELVEAGDLEACWPWKGYQVHSRHFPSQNGYGRLPWRGKLAQSHRVAWEITRGSVPAGLCVLHRCDNPPCCNPTHLFLGTHRVNTDDKMAKGRVPRGEKHYAATLNEVAVRVIKYFLERGMPQKRLAQAYGVHVRNISNINTGKTWRHVA